MGVELLYNWVEFESKSSFQQTSRQLETRCGRESHTRPRGHSENPRWSGPQDLWLNIKRTRKTQRDGHNSGVKIWSLCLVSSTLSHAKPWTTLSNPCNKVRGEYFSKEVFLRLPSCILIVLASFITVSVIIASVCMQYIYVCNNTMHLDTFTSHSLIK